MINIAASDLGWITFAAGFFFGAFAGAAAGIGLWIVATK